MSDYRLEACSACGIVRLVIRTALTIQRERDRIDRLSDVDGARVWIVDFCLSCREAYEAQFRQRVETTSRQQARDLAALREQVARLTEELKGQS